jgi:hypothetical protein
MAIATVDTVIADMMFVAERDRLAARDADLGDVRRFIDCRERRHQTDQQNGATENGEPGDRVRARMKNLRHLPANPTTGAPPRRAEKSLNRNGLRRLHRPRKQTNALTESVGKPITQLPRRDTIIDRDHAHGNFEQ